MEKLVANKENFSWHGKRVLITGHTGFKGSWLTLWLKKLGAEIFGISLPPNTSPNLYELANVGHGIESHFIDIRDSKELASCVHKISPEIVFHLAAQPLVLKSYQEPILTFDTNIMGSVHLLEALKSISTIKVVIMVTTDKVYYNDRRLSPYSELDPLGGVDPYSSSKAASEIVIASYRDAYFAKAGVALASARAGNVIGGGDWSEDRLIPDAVRSWERNISLKIRNPQFIRPWQHVLEPLNGYIALAQKLWANPELSGPYNFGPLVEDVFTVAEVIEKARHSFGYGEISYSNQTKDFHESQCLILDASKANKYLEFKSRWNITETIDRTMKWYRDQIDGANALLLCESEIKAYEETL